MTLLWGKMLPGFRHAGFLVSQGRTLMVLPVFYDTIQGVGYKNHNILIRRLLLVIHLLPIIPLMPVIQLASTL